MVLLPLANSMILPSLEGPPQPQTYCNRLACVPTSGDFGLAKPMESTDLTHNGILLGTPSSMALTKSSGLFPVATTVLSRRLAGFPLKDDA
jgi:hypothetical protein